MGGQVSEEALARLKSVTQDTGRLVAQALEPVDEAIREIDIPFRSSHFAEDCRDWHPPEKGRHRAHASRFAFCIESTGNRATEYSLCAARGPDGQCGLYVSVCEYHEEGERGTADPLVVVDRVFLTIPEKLSLWARVQMLDELSQGNFIKAYEEYIRQDGDRTPADGVMRPWLPTWSA